jgi:hypothetical protein
LNALGFGANIFRRLPLSPQVNLYTNAQLGITTLAGDSIRSAPDALGL